MTTKENAIIFLSIFFSFIAFMVIDLRLAKLVLDAMHVSISPVTNLVVLVFIIIETYMVYRTVKWALIAKKRESESFKTSETEE